MPAAAQPRPVSTVGSPPAPIAEGDLAALFPWDRSYVFLNHGSFGSMPHEVRAAQDRWRAEIEARPIEMLGRRIGELLEPARTAVAGFVGTDAKRLGFVVNATDGINAVLRSLSWQRGDEIVVLDHVYNAMRQSVRRLGDEFGVVMREVSVPLPVKGPEDFVHATVAAFGPRTRMVLIDHITSPTALVVPVARIVQEARTRGIYTLVDGAHAPGSIELSVDAIGADAYTANLHKWCCAPKGCAFLSVAAAVADSTHALATSHPYREGFVREFEWQGTRDMTPWLTAPAALSLFARFGWPRVREHNHAMATWTQAFLSEQWGTELLSPRDGSMLASMAPIAVPEAVQRRFEGVAALQAHLYEHDRIELPVIDWHGRWHVRVSCHLHTAPWMVERLCEAVRTLARG